MIVLFLNDQIGARLLFILAHELGHLARGHVPDGGVLIDENVNKNELDNEEEQANAFAIELLTGNVDGQFRTTGQWPNAPELARRAKEVGSTMKIDPGHIVLNYAHTMGDGFWPVANAALARITPEKDGLKLIRAKMADHLDWSKLPEDSCEFLMRLSQTRPRQ